MLDILIQIEDKMWKEFIHYIYKSYKLLEAHKRTPFDMIYQNFLAFTKQRYLVFNIQN